MTEMAGETATDRPGPRVVHPDHDREFNRVARDLGIDPASQWIGGYVDYEWRRLRPLLQAYGVTVAGCSVLEFGSNVGASAVVLASLGADVQAVEVDTGMVRLARANAARYGLERIAVRHVPDTRALPFAAGTFDLVTCNSVLEYVDPEHLPQIMAELARVLRPSGGLFISGTASRLAPRELHSKRWLVNYLPRSMDRWLGRSFQRGLDPFLLRRVTAGFFEESPPRLAARDWLRGRAAVHGRATPAMRLVAAIAPLLGMGPGWLTPWIAVLLRKTG
jgi:SAM-dependent methyltransferase